MIHRVLNASLAWAVAVVLLAVSCGETKPVSRVERTQLEPGLYFITFPEAGCFRIGQNEKGGPIVERTSLSPECQWRVVARDDAYVLQILGATKLEQHTGASSATGQSWRDRFVILPSPTESGQWFMTAYERRYDPPIPCMRQFDDPRLEAFFDALGEDREAHRDRLIEWGEAIARDQPEDPYHRLFGLDAMIRSKSVEGLERELAWWRTAGSG